MNYFKLIGPSRYDPSVDMGDWLIPAIGNHLRISRLVLEYDTEKEEKNILALLDLFPIPLSHLELQLNKDIGWGTGIAWGTEDESEAGGGTGWANTQQALPVPTNPALPLAGGNDISLPRSFEYLQSLRARWTIAEKIISDYGDSLVRLDVEFDQGGESWPHVSLLKLLFLRVRHGRCVDEATEKAMFDGIVKSAPNLQVLIVRVDNKGNVCSS